MEDKPISSPVHAKEQPRPQVYKVNANNAESNPMPKDKKPINAFSSSKKKPVNKKTDNLSEESSDLYENQE